MQTNIYYKYYENIENPLCSKVLLKEISITFALSHANIIFHPGALYVNSMSLCYITIDFTDAIEKF